MLYISFWKHHISLERDRILALHMKLYNSLSPSILHVFICRVYSGCLTYSINYCTFVTKQFCHRLLWKASQWIFKAQIDRFLNSTGVKGYREKQGDWGWGGKIAQPCLNGTVDFDRPNVLILFFELMNVIVMPVHGIKGNWIQEPWKEKIAD